MDIVSLHVKRNLIMEILSSEEVFLQSFPYAELEKVPDNFKEELGRGAFGMVYKGEIGNGKKLVAVKRLEKLLAEREREFQTEMKVIGRTHHKNLVHLLGYCHDGPNRLLVYEYMSNGSPADILFTPEKQPCWDQRMEIARDIAKGILYICILHLLFSLSFTFCVLIFSGFMYATFITRCYGLLFREQFYMVVI